VPDYFLLLFLPVKVLFYAMNVTAALLFFRIARNWKLIVRCWHEKEMVFLKKPYGYQKEKLRVKVNRLVVVLFVTSLGKCSFDKLSSRPEIGNGN
jgi:Trehalose receptor